jgi:hypothetical protein
VRATSRFTAGSVPGKHVANTNSATSAR